MKAVVYEAYGAPEVLQLRDVAKPVPKENEVLIKIVATTVTAADWRMRKAYPFLVRFFNGLFKPTKIKILGWELSGIIEEVGEQVHNFSVGDEIFASPELSCGAYAEYICLPVNAAIVKKPVNMSFEEAAAVPLGGSTAYFFLEQAHIQKGQDVLIYGASGSVGTYAVQLAKNYGANVTGVCSQANMEMVASLGADKVLDYTAEDFSLAENSYDVICDTVGKSSFSACAKALKKQGCFLNINDNPVTTLQGFWMQFTSSKKFILGEAKATSENLGYLKTLIEQDKIKAVIDRKYKLEQIVEAHHYVQQGHKKGNVIVLL